MYRSGSTGDVVPSHTGGEPGAGGGVRTVAGRWLSPTRFIVAATIVVTVVLWLIPTLLRARQPTWEAECMGHLKQVGWAMSMYAGDNNDYPSPANWHQALWPYIESRDDRLGRLVPGSKRDPLKCPRDPSDATVSYLYLDRRVLTYTMSRLSESITPLAVDEYFHEHVTMVYYDGHTDKMEKTRWAYERLRQWQIRRDLDDPESFSYELIPGTQMKPAFAPPAIERTERYIWPRF